MRSRRWSLGSVLVVASGLSTACGGDGASSPAVPGSGGAGSGSANAGGTSSGGTTGANTGGDARTSGGSSAVPSTPSPAYVALKAQADAAQALGATQAAAVYPTAFQPLGYDPLEAAYLDRIQASALALSADEKAALGKNGFVISTAREFPTFVTGLAQIYSEHLPVFVTADAVLESVHSSYDQMLLSIERAIIESDVRSLLLGMRDRLSSSSAPQETRADLDVYLAVALSLLQGSQSDTVAGGDVALVSSLVRQATAGSGTATIGLFGSSRTEDFSQFTPRGHYSLLPELEQYFRAMIWLGRVDLRLVETDSSGVAAFHRPPFDAMLALRDLLGPDLSIWQRIDDMLRTFIGESDNMVVPQVDQLIADLGGSAAAHAASDDAIVTALRAGGYGEQRIASYLMVNDGTVKTIPLNRSFLLFGQRYIVDSEVFSAVVYDRIAARMMPNPLDAAFGALANNQAFALDADVGTYGELPGALARMRVLVDSNTPAFWESSFYNLWLSSLRALSPAADTASVPAGLPRVANTEAWGRRILNTQLGSWAELRHDSLLYAKQSYTAIPSCDYPDAYVDPYPKAFGAIRKYAEQGARIAALVQAVNPPLADGITGYFERLRSASTILEQIATQELAGQPLTAPQLAFINDAVRIKQETGCVIVDYPDGWLAKLYFQPLTSIEFAPTIADVHTQPADSSGATVGKVLHVGTGYPRFMVATVDSCDGAARAYAGVVFAYHEQITTNFDRLTDDRWAVQFASAGTRPPEVPWMSSVTAH